LSSHSTLSYRDMSDATTLDVLWRTLGIASINSGNSTFSHCASKFPDVDYRYIIYPQKGTLDANPMAFKHDELLAM